MRPIVVAAAVILVCSIAAGADGRTLPDSFRTPGATNPDVTQFNIGGDPQSPQNLWPQAYAGKCGARAKDAIETRLKKLVCSPKPPLTLVEAQQMISRDWVAAYNQYVRPLKCPTP